MSLHQVMVDAAIAAPVLTLTFAGIGVARNVRHPAPETFQTLGRAWDESRGAAKPLYNRKRIERDRIMRVMAQSRG